MLWTAPPPARKCHGCGCCCRTVRDSALVAWYRCFTHLAREGRMTVTIGRRELLAALGGAAAWPLAARAQQTERVRRIGVFMPGTADDSEYQAGTGAFLEARGELGGIRGRNVRIDSRWGGGDVARYRATAANLVSLAPDVVLAEGTATVSALQKATRSVPIIFVDVV